MQGLGILIRRAVNRIPAPQSVHLVEPCDESCAYQVDGPCCHTR